MKAPTKSRVDAVADLQAQRANIPAQLRGAAVAGDIDTILELRRTRAELDDRIAVATIVEHRAAIARWAAELAEVEPTAQQTHAEFEQAHAVFASLPDAAPWPERERARQVVDAAERAHRVAQGPVDVLRARIRSTERDIDRVSTELAALGA